MKKTRVLSMRIKRTLMALLLMFALSFGTAFATDGTASTDGGASAVQTVTTSTEPAAKSEAKSTVASAPAKAVSHIVKKGKYYYYKDPKTGKIRKKKGFVRDNGNLYYIGKKKGRILAGKTFKVKKKYYHSYGNGRIATGVYKWGKKLYYSDPKTGQWIKKECIVSWNGNKYYIQKGGKILKNDAFGYKNVPYKADSAGRLKRLTVPDTGNVVIKVAKQQVGVMTGKTYWKWYFHTKFKNADATPWCGAFVAWCFNQAGVYDKVVGIKKFGNLGYVPSYSKYANNKGKWVNKNKAQAGDILIFAGSVHVGLVEGVTDGCVVTIEGNAGPTAFIRGKPGAVIRRAIPLNSKKIKGVIRVF